MEILVPKARVGETATLGLRAPQAAKATVVPGGSMGWPDPLVGPAILGEKGPRERLVIGVSRDLLGHPAWRDPGAILDLLESQGRRG